MLLKVKILNFYQVVIDERIRYIYSIFFRLPGLHILLIALVVVIKI